MPVAGRPVGDDETCACGLLGANDEPLVFIERRRASDQRPARPLLYAGKRNGLFRHDRRCGACARLDLIGHCTKNREIDERDSLKNLILLAFIGWEEFFDFFTPTFCVEAGDFLTSDVKKSAVAVVIMTIPFSPAKHYIVSVERRRNDGF